ncbi:MAG: hypothetical protein JJT95_04425 [Pararhodobacter sp.]|nr:hypothetical protein [Pararhodobacter sp.]
MIHFNPDFDMRYTKLTRPELRLNAGERSQPPGIFFDKAGTAAERGGWL